MPTVQVSYKNGIGALYGNMTIYTSVFDCDR